MSLLASVRDRYRETVDPLRTARRIELVAVIIALLLILQLVYGAYRLAIGSTPDPVSPTADSLQVKSPARLQTITTEQSSEIRRRPLFWPDRRPLEAVGEKSIGKAASEQEIKEIKLLGVFGSGASVGIIASAKGQVRRLHPGEQVDGWKLESVGDNEVVFTAGSRRAKLALHHASIQPPAEVANKRQRGR